MTYLVWQVLLSKIDAKKNIIKQHHKHKDSRDCHVQTTFIHSFILFEFYLDGKVHSRSNRYHNDDDNDDSENKKKH
ncbi:hypothetical protein DERP_005615 [Dermatophagoides pteronyssinus]|uniref:Uncharacterized protein n=1 Tax=Dermatophagoides pteronyssinus TaxID=6956 RepID=A0ABQ8J9S1_DERPT|nr:hypothetical protein DERP_005615 [Dermatophagoides pteronyssinus]